MDRWIFEMLEKLCLIKYTSVYLNELNIFGINELILIYNSRIFREFINDFTKKTLII